MDDDRRSRLQELTLDSSKAIQVCRMEYCWNRRVWALKDLEITLRLHSRYRVEEKSAGRGA